jgi:hypothetical protein
MPVETLEFKWPKKTNAAADVAKRFKSFQETTPEPPKRLHDDNITAFPILAHRVAAIHEMHLSTTALSDAVAVHNMDTRELLGTLSSAMITVDFIKYQASYKQALPKAKTKEDTERLNVQWRQGVAVFTQAFAAMGLPGIEEDHLNAFAKELQADKKVFSSIVTIANTAVGGKAVAMNALSQATGGFVPYTAKLGLAQLGNIVLPWNLCKSPFAQGVITKHLYHTFSLQVHIDYPCLQWCTGWFGVKYPCGWGWCNSTYTIANLSYNVDLQIGYKVTCCGGTAWGSAAANVCASVLGYSFCAGCSATLVGAVGLTQTPSGTNCSYGLGLTAELKCTFSGITIFDVMVPIGYTFQGPCPPVKLPC